jgi:CheY-like chemotaxis protein
MVSVLIADDDPPVRLLLRTILRRDGHAVLEATDGAEALRLLREARPAIAILDVEIPPPSGLDICRGVRADPDLAGIRLIVVTGSASESDAMAAGADVYLAKPFSPSQLSAAVAGLAAEGP